MGSDRSVSEVIGVRGLLVCSRELRLIRSNNSNLDEIEHGRDSCEYSDRQLSSFPRVCTEREQFRMFAGFEIFDFSVLIEHWLERMDLISVKLAQEVITSGIAKLQRPNKYIPWIYNKYIQQFLTQSGQMWNIFVNRLTEGIFDNTRCRQRAKNYFIRNHFPGLRQKYLQGIWT